MGALADYTAFADGIAGSAALGAGMRLPCVASTGATEGRGVNDYFGTPTTAAACNASTTGALFQQPKLPDTLTAQYWLAQCELMAASNGSAGVFFDRLSHQGGLSGTVTTAQTTNLPTAALTRYTDGKGVCIGIQIYTSIGATNTTLTCSYTNQAGTAGSTSKAISIGGTGRSNGGTLLLVPLQDGDTGVRSVESVTLAATTGTAGAFGVVLLKPLWLQPLSRAQDLPSYVNGLMAGKMIEIEPNACLMFSGHYGNAAGMSVASLSLIEA